MDNRVQRMTGGFPSPEFQFWPSLRVNSSPKGDSDVGDIVMLVTILRCWWQKMCVGDIFLYVGRIPICYQHHNMPECDVGEWFVMLET